MKKLYFLIGSQDLYGDETLRQAEKDGFEMAAFLDSALGENISITALPIVRNSLEAQDCITKANLDKDCIGIICWMHTFSPSKMWIKALQNLTKPMLHLHTQYNEKLPYDSIDMDFMNLNQSAHGDREFGFMCTRLGIKREVVVDSPSTEIATSRLSSKVSPSVGLNVGSGTSSGSGVSGVSPPP